MHAILKNSTLRYSLVFCLLFVLLSVAIPGQLAQAISVASGFVLKAFGNFYLFLGLFVVLFMLVLAISPVGRVRLGGPDARPEFSVISWVAMLYSTGMGAGLLLRAVQEPVYYFNNPPVEVSYPPDYLALEYTFFHWGLTPWAFYGMFGLIIGYYLFRYEGKLLSSTILEGVWRNPRTINGLDSLTAITTMLGVVGAVGLGGTQVVGGLNHLWGWPLGLAFTILIVLIIGSIATLSALTGLGNGIRYISNINISGATFLLLFVAFQSDSGLLLERFGTALWFYFRDFFQMSLNMGKYHASQEFMADWTYFYWAFWIAWTPFTGIFIARISKGRTIRQFIIGTLLTPALGTFIWFTVFGSNAFELIKTAGSYDGRFDSIFNAIFLFFENYPLAGLANLITVLILFTFLITSVDSAIFVLSMFTDKGNEQPDRRHGLLWGILLTCFTLALLILGQGTLLRSTSQLLILAALPFGFILLFMCLVFVQKLLRR